MKDNSYHLAENGYLVCPLASLDPVRITEGVLRQYLNYSAWDLSNLPRDKFHEAVERCQEKINSDGVLELFVHQNAKQISELIGEDDLSFVSVMKLRAVRPCSMLKANESDNVGFHRESFYAVSKQVYFQQNCWIPISDTASSSGMWYLPKSHLILDEELEICENMNDPVKVDRYSAGHRIGLPYRPKCIGNSHLLESIQPQRFHVGYGSFVIFSAMLIHGGGKNIGHDTRISIDTGALPTRRIDKNGPLFASNGKPHYARFK